MSNPHIENKPTIDRCDACGCPVNVETDVHQLAWKKGWLRLTCRTCSFPDDQTLKGDDSEINRQLLPIDRVRLHEAGLRMEAKITDDIRREARREEILWALMGAIVIAGIAGAIVALIYAMTVRP